MSRLVSRILLSMFMFPLAVMVYAVTCGLVESMSGVSYRIREQMMFVTADVITWAGVAVYWSLLWRGSVRWTARRIGFTLGSAAVGVAVGGVVARVIASALMRGNGDEAFTFTLFLGGVIAILMWLFATVFVWRETTAERAARIGATGGATVACPVCGYNLTGLSDARCPECGSRFTLNELFAGQPTRPAGELD